MGSSIDKYIKCLTLDGVKSISYSRLTLGCEWANEEGMKRVRRMVGFDVKKGQDVENSVELQYHNALSSKKF